MKKVILTIIITLITFAASVTFTHFYKRDDNLSVHYLLWKKGIHLGNSQKILGGIGADPNRDEIIRGRTKSDVIKLFPSAHEQSVNQHQRYYEKEISNRDYLWLGETHIIIFFENGFGKRISLMKG